MNVYGIIFYLMAAVMILATVMAITRSNIVHSVLYLVVSFLCSALLYFLLGAPLLAAFEVIIYAGAIMVLFLFIVMMLKIETPAVQRLPLRHYLAAFWVCVIYFLVCILLMHFSAPSLKQPMMAASASPAFFGKYVFQHHWMAIEMASLLLLVALIGAMHLGVGHATYRGKGEAS